MVKYQIKNTSIYNSRLCSCRSIGKVHTTSMASKVRTTGGRRLFGACLARVQTPPDPSDMAPDLPTGPLSFIFYHHHRVHHLPSSSCSTVPRRTHWRAPPRLFWHAHSSAASGYTQTRRLGDRPPFCSICLQFHFQIATMLVQLILHGSRKPRLYSNREMEAVRNKWHL